MARKIVISGGNSGIGLEAARQLAAQGHQVILLGRDQAKGDAAAAGIRQAGGAAEFLAADLSTHAGVRAAAQKLAAAHPKLDGLLLGAGVLMMGEARTADGLYPVFAVNYLSRFHLTELLLPQLKAASEPSVVLLAAGVPLKTRINFDHFPKYDPFPGTAALSGIQIANYHYVAHLAKAEPAVRAAVMNVGLVKTEIMRAMPAVMRFGFTLLGPFVTIPVERAASNAAWLSSQPGWKSGCYWPKPGKPDVFEALALDPAETAKVVAASRQLTGLPPG